MRSLQPARPICAIVLLALLSSLHRDSAQAAAVNTRALLKGPWRRQALSTGSNAGDSGADAEAASNGLGALENAIATCSLANEQDLPASDHRLHPLKLAAFNLWQVPGCTRMHKRVAMRHALLNSSSHQLPLDAKHAELQRAAEAVVTELASLATGEQGVCKTDDTLPRGLLPDMRYLLAANLRNNQDLMPHWIHQLLLAILGKSPESADSWVLVSVYESGSSDDTPKFLAVLEVLLVALGVPHSITASGNLTRNGEERISFLAKVRNAALAPLAAHHQYPDGFPADKVIFINDVWFCAQHTVRLSQYKSADIACGMDFEDLGVQRPTYTFYDYWVSRDLAGRRFSPNMPIVSDSHSAEALAQGWPFAATCCWNGLAVLNAAPFRKHGLAFRGRTGEDECFASECSLLCDDFARLGFQRILVDPSVRQAYDAWISQLLSHQLLPDVSIPERTWASVVARHIERGWSEGGIGGLNPGSGLPPQRQRRTHSVLLSSTRHHVSSGLQTVHQHTSQQHGMAHSGRSVLSTTHISSHTGAWPRDIVARFWDAQPLPGQRECCRKFPHKDELDFSLCVMDPLMAPNFTDTALQQVASAGGLQAAARVSKVGTCYPGI